MKHRLQKSNQSGMTLVEILVSMLIGAVLLAGVLSVFINSKQTYRTQEALSRLQENGRFAMDFIAKDLRMADYWGCMRRDSGGPTNNINGTAHNFYADGGMDGTQGVIDGGGYSGLDDPDSLTIRGITSAGIFLTAPMPPDDPLTPAVDESKSADLTATAHGFTANAGDFLFVTDCNNGDIFQPSAVTVNTISHAGATGAPGNSGAELSATYGTDAQVHSVSTIVYSIANGASDLPSLFRSTNGLNQELIEGVENMQVLYGEDTDADGAPNHYVSWSAALNMNQVISVRIRLLLQSTDDNITTRPTPVAYNGGTANDDPIPVANQDRRLRRVVTSTIALRNRL